MATEKPVNLNISDQLKKDEEFRKLFFRSIAQNEIAAQIIKLRTKRNNMRQIDLADAADMKQSAISRIEKAAYAKWNYQTLTRIAEALQARLRIIIEPIEDAIAEYEHESIESYVTAAAFSETNLFQCYVARTHEFMSNPAFTVRAPESAKLVTGSPARYENVEPHVLYN